MQIATIDTLEISYDVTKYDKVFKEFLSELQISKTYLQIQQEKDADARNFVTIQGATFEIMPNGSKNHAYILHSHSYEIRLAKGRSKNKNFFPIIVRIKSSALWSKSPEVSCVEIYQLIQSINSNVTMKIKERIKRVDLCCHTDKFSIIDTTIPEFQGKYRTNTIFRNGNKIETFGIGSRKNPVYCRIYNKSKEVFKSLSKLWFLDVWRYAGINQENVWNVEFELKREFLNDVGINTTYDLFSNMKSLWQYCTSEWLQHKTLVNTRIERCPVSDEWKVIQSAFNKYEGKSYITRNKQSEINAHAILPTIIGYMTSFASCFKDMDIDKAIKEILFLGDKYLTQKETDYQTVINQKRRQRTEVLQ